MSTDELKAQRAKELGKFLGLKLWSIRNNQQLYFMLSQMGWRWDAPSLKWINRNNHPHEIG